MRVLRQPPPGRNHRLVGGGKQFLENDHNLGQHLGGGIYHLIFPFSTPDRRLARSSPNQVFSGLLLPPFLVP
jgi:hypothetical protein